MIVEIDRYRYVPDLLAAMLPRLNYSAGLATCTSFAYFSWVFFELRQIVPVRVMLELFVFHVLFGRKLMVLGEHYKQKITLIAVFELTYLNKFNSGSGVIRIIRRRVRTLDNANICSGNNSHV